MSVGKPSSSADRAAGGGAARAVFAGGGEMGEVMASWDWSVTPVGPPEQWPASLRQVVEILLTSRFSMWMAWGPELAFFYNDAYRRDTLGSKHPWALGRPARQVWAEIWDDIGPRIRSVLDTGEATWDESLLLFLERAGYVEETYHTFSYSPLRDEDGRVAGMLCVVSEDTERVLGERRLRILSELGDISAITAPTLPQACTAALEVAQRHRLDIPFASVYLLDDDGVQARRAGFYGMVDDPGIVPELLDRVVYPAAPLWAMLDTGRPQVLHQLAADFPALFVAMPEPMHTRDPESVLAVPLAGVGGEPVGVLFAGISPFRALDEDYQRFIELLAAQVSTAITNAQAYQAQRHRAEELAELDRAKTEFFTGVSHELRTPLTLITGPAEDGLADTAEPLPPGQRARMELIARNGGRLCRLVDTLLEFARLEDGALVADRVAVDLAALTRGIGESFAPAITRAGLEFVIDCPDLDGPGWVAVDVDMWEKIVLNLLSNAVKYTLAGGVGLALRATDTDPAGVELRVTDTGIGIPADEQAELFRRFHRVRGAAGRSHEGSGIGLALVAELAGLHGATATVHSTLGRGSTFVVTLPATARISAAPAPRAASDAVGRYREEALQWSEPLSLIPELTPGGQTVTPTSQGGSTPGVRVLVAEDNPDLRRFVAGLLEPHYTVLLAADGNTALECARREHPDLVLTDVMMPGLDGFELLAALRADPATAAIPVIVLSARAGPEAVGQGLAAGADDYLVKPFSSADLLARVRSNLAMARLRNTEGAWRTALLNALQDALVVVDAAGRVVEINDAFCEVLGYGSEDLPYTVPYPWWPDPAGDPDDYAAVLEVFAAARTTGGRFLVPQRHRDGRRLWIEASTSILADPHGDGPMIVAVFRDVTAAHRGEQRDRLLAETGRLLTQPGGLAERLSEVTAAAAPVLADLAVVSLAGPDGRFTPTAASHRSDPAVAKALLELAAHAIPETLRERFRAGRAFVLGEVPDRMLVEASRDEADLTARRGLSVASSLVTPLVVAGRLLGSLTFVSTHRARAHDDADLALAEELGRRVAVAVEAQRVAAREQQLRAATAALADSATVAEAAAALATAVTAATAASGVAVWVAGSDDPQLRLVHSVGYPPEITEAFTRIRTDADLPVAEAVRTRSPVWLGDEQAWQVRYPHLAVPDVSAGARAFAAVPLLVGDRVVGGFAARFATVRAFPADECSFTMTLAGLVATAFDRAAITDAHFQIAQTLQRSLLPTRLPALPRLALAAHYEPAGQYAQAGGDWYDVITLDEDRVAIVVGDVVGNGPAAAAVMGQLRSALAGFLLESHAPVHGLGWLSRLAQQIDGALGSTAICMVLHTGTGELRWARAGHPPPLLLQPAGAPERARYLEDAHGLVLGVPDMDGVHVPYDEGHLVLAPGSSVLVYTDGLVERRGETIDDGLDRLAAAAAAAADAPPAALLGAALAGCRDGTAADDIALLVARLLPAPLDHRLPAQPEQLRGLRRTIGDWAAAAALAEELAQDLQLALGEAVANCVEHAYAGGPPGDLTYRVDRAANGELHVEVRDEGTWRPAPADPGFRGRGLAMIDKLGSDVVLDTTGPGTHIRFTLPVPPAELPAPPAELGTPPRAGSSPIAALIPARLSTHRGPDGALVIALVGELDGDTIDAVRTDLLDRLATSTGEVILDMGGVSYLASAGVGLLVQAHLAAPDRVGLHVPAGSPTARILALTGLDQQLPAVPPDHPALARS